MTDIAHPLTSRRMSLPIAVIVALVAAAVPAVALSAVIAAIAHGAGASHDFKALTISAYAPLIVIGLLAGALGWLVIRRRSSDPARLLGWLAPTVVALSLIPDVMVGVGHSLAGSSWGGVSALMIMHVVVAACGIAAYRIFLPLNRAPLNRPAPAMG